jgi:hypothetical protein
MPVTVAHCAAFFAEFNPSADVHNRDTAYLPSACRHFHWQLLGTANPKAYRSLKLYQELYSVECTKSNIAVGLA